MAGFVVEPLADDIAAGQLLALHAADPAGYPVLLDSAAAGTPQGRYSLLLALPGERLELAPSGELTGPGGGGTFLERLDAWWREQCGPAAPAGMPFAGGWFLYLGYEFARQVEPCLRLPEPRLGPVALAWRMRGAIVHDHATGRSWATVEESMRHALPQLCADLRRAPASLAPLPADAVTALAEDPPGRFLDACERALGHVAAGDIYQANLARAWRAQLRPGLSRASLYAALRRANPGPFAGSAELGGFAVLSSSPERLVRLAAGRLDSRPIAGTRPRDPATDAATIAELVAHPKERAEHIMLLDLERNDLGRVAAPGSVHVDEYMVIESYAHVHHLVSNVTALAQAGITPAQVVRALFPGGTITGCPKVRCMQLIGELEGAPRGAYTGSMGYVGLDGALDLNILIRTLQVEGDVATLHAGAGIVADSVPERELAETRAKARGVLRALGVAA